MPTLDEMVAENKKRHTCLGKFQKFMECMTPKHQFTTYYRFGTHADCPKLMASWQICLRAKVRSQKEQADADRLRDWRASVDRVHVLPFKSIYREEAYERYGVIVAEEAGVIERE
mmetsp:Transcript_46800/g.101656  ORF Transcript_46800/g.101656 Transcript_46800/m.101656 type:complete len:115 (+) Transcript_46800:470-814(+)